MSHFDVLDFVQKGLLTMVVVGSEENSMFVIHVGFDPGVGLHWRNALEHDVTP